MARSGGAVAVAVIVITVGSIFNVSLQASSLGDRLRQLRITKCSGRCAEAESDSDDAPRIGMEHVSGRLPCSWRSFIGGIA